MFNPLRSLKWSSGSRSFPSRMVFFFFSPTLPVTEDFHPAINLHYGPVSSCLAAANSNRLRQLLLTASLMAANERHLGAVDPCGHRHHGVAQGERLNMGPVLFGISHQLTAASSILTKCCIGTESNHRSLDSFELP